MGSGIDFQVLLHGASFATLESCLFAPVLPKDMSWWELYVQLTLFSRALTAEDHRAHEYWAFVELFSDQL